MKKIIKDLGRGKKSVAAITLAAITLLTAEGTASGTDGSALFNENCRSCHGDDGKAQTVIGRKLGARDLTQSKLSKEQIIHQIREGKLDPNSSSKMRAFKDELDEDEIRAISEFVLELRKQ